MHDDGLQTQDELEETPLLIEIDDAVEFDVIPTACENPVLVDQLLSRHGIEHTLQVDVSVIDLEDQSEGDAALKLGDLCTQANPTVATYLGAHNEMFVRVTAKGKDKASARKLALPVVEKVKNLLGDVIYGVNVESLEEVVVHELAERHEEVATAESCTGGLLAKRITDIPGSSAVFRTGLVTYANATKTRLLGVPEDMLREHGAVSEEVARCMAEEARARAGADYGIGITGIAGPDGGTAEKPLGLVWIALATKEKTYVKRLLPKGRYPGRGPTRQKSAGTALDMLRPYLEGKPVTD